jgi:nicotinamidase-related amidase
MDSMSRHPNLLHRDTSLLLVIDLQTSFVSAIDRWDDCLKNARLLIQAARELGIPIIPTTQNVTRLGGIVPEIAEALGPARAFDKLTFSCVADSFLADAIRGARRQQVVLCGIETHICVAQTALELQALGYQPHIAVDAVSSRSLEKHKLGMERLRDNNVFPAATESIVYEWLGIAGTPEFRALLPLIKEAS